MKVRLTHSSWDGTSKDDSGRPLPGEVIKAIVLDEPDAMIEAERITIAGVGEITSGQRALYGALGFVTDAVRREQREGIIPIVSFLTSVLEIERLADDV